MDIKAFLLGLELDTCSIVVAFLGLKCDVEYI